MTGKYRTERIGHFPSQCRFKDPLAALMAQAAELMRQLVRDAQVEGRSKDGIALAVVTRVQEMRMAQQRKDPVETCKENQEEEDTVGMQEDIPDTQVGDAIEGQGSGEEISVDNDCPLRIELLFDKELFGKPGKPRAHLT